MPQTKPQISTSGSGSNNEPPLDMYNEIFDELFPGWDNENLQAFDYEDFLVREGLA